MMAKVRNRMRSRPGNGAPVATVRGSDRAITSESAPRNPAHPMKTTLRNGGIGSGRPSSPMAPRTMYVPGMTHTIRTRTAATDTATTAAASVPIAYSWRAATATGSSRPTRMNTSPSSRKVSISHIATACVRVCGEITRGPWRPR